MKFTILTDIGLKLDMPEWKEILSKFDVDIYHDTTPDLVLERSRGSEILLTNKVVLNADTLAQLPEVKYIIMASTGTNVVDLNYCHEHGIWASNVPAYSTNSVAQLVFSHLLNIYTHADHYAEKNRDGAWSQTTDFCYTDSPLYELYGKTLGIVGLGAIGQRVAKIALGIGMNVVALSGKKEVPASLAAMAATEEDECAANICVTDSADDFYASADVITFHCPLTANNAEMVNADTIAKMKDGVVIINTARGGLINEADLRAALDSGKVAAFAADVLATEPAQKDNLLCSHPNVYITPHVGWMTEEALVRLNKTIIRNIHNYLETKEPIDKV